MTTIGPLSGAEARAYRHPPTAARAVPSAARKMMKVKRRGRDTARFRLFLELFDNSLGLRRFLRCRVGGDHFFERLDRGVLVALVQLHQRQLEERLAPRAVHVGRLLVQ